MTARKTNASIPLYRRISNEIVEGIVSGHYPVGSLLPTEEDFCRRFGVSRHTVREALRAVEAMGLVSRRQGQGTRVQGPSQARSLRVSFRTLHDLEQHSYDVRLTGIRAATIEADDKLALELPCVAGDRFVRIRCSQDPIDPLLARSAALHENFVIEPYGALAENLAAHKGPIYHLLERLFGETIREIEQDVSAVALTAKQARALDVPLRSAGLRIKRTYHGRAHKPVMFTYNTYAGHHFTLSLRLRRG
ncbi:GntR family transcriptional regulator [Marinivivus vitaminiproducens]|uniref:GntR family transcriptional regulator n=1 Tax=Marinivivus vitaminiproducens TaxID=3035935 RepID=UPI00279CF8F3|nr:GntR family transcriptional regulator [Geminicoccaceae bacterium SCSIO 64248]